ncbi:hypothetical protein [Methylobacterium sp. ID0610]|uniref:hypothetical protein n=1 Tax=Methylobacterium carpenticola TaxID=3344827 RepID=UPI0036B0564C
MDAIAAFEVGITTVETCSILRADTERGAAVKAEALLRRVHARGELTGLRATGPDSPAALGIKHDLNDVMAEVERSDGI